MPFLIECPSGHRLKVPRKRTGQRMRCPVCDQAFVVPAKHRDSGFLSDSEPSVAIEECDEFNASSRGDLPLTPPAARNSTRSADQSASPAEPQPLLRGNDSAASGKARQHELDGAGRTDVLLSLAIVPRRIDARRAVSHQASERRFSALWLGWSTLLAALASAAPALYTLLVRQSQVVQQIGDVWTYVVLLGSSVLFALSIYFLQIPHWTTSWLVALGLTGVTVCYAMVLGLCMFASPDDVLLQKVGLIDEVFSGMAQRWCFLVICVVSMLTYCYSRTSLAWYRADRLLVESQS